MDGLLLDTERTLDWTLVARQVGLSKFLVICPVINVPLILFQGLYSVAQQAILDKWNRHTSVSLVLPLAWLLFPLELFLMSRAARRRKFTWDLKAKMMGKKVGWPSWAERSELPTWHVGCYCIRLVRVEQPGNSGLKTFAAEILSLAVKIVWQQTSANKFARLGLHNYTALNNSSDSMRQRIKCGKLSTRQATQITIDIYR